MIDRRRAPEVDNPLLVVLCTLFMAALYIVLIAVLIKFAFASGPDAQPAGGRAACEPWPRVDGAFSNPPEVAAGSAADSSAPR